ncbi:MAG: hypothetical protein ABI833_15465 [Acidobacteriota bacterium]
MTPQELEVREDQVAGRLSTADLAEAGNRPAGTPSPMPAKNGAPERSEPLFVPSDAQDFRSRWEKIQIGFVDEPRKSVEQDDELVASAIKRLAEVFARERQTLEAEWDKNDNVSTEDL